MNDASKVRQRISTPPTVAVSSETEVESRSKHARRLFVLLRSRRKVLFFFQLSILVLFHKKMLWTWKNRYLYVGCPEYSLWLRPHGQKQHRVLHLTAKFGSQNDEYKQEVDEHVDKVIKSGVFTRNEIIAYTSFPSYILQDPSWKDHLRFLNNTRHASRRGGGYWFWKPTIIYHELQKLADGDFVVFTDADREDFVSWTPLLIETMLDRNADLALEEMQFLEREWTKGDIYAKLCPQLLPDDGLQYTGNFLLVRKNRRTLQFIMDFMEASKDYHLISDERSNVPNQAGFMFARHDQSLLSILIRCDPYSERDKHEFVWTCLGDWRLYMFQLQE